MNFATTLNATTTTTTTSPYEQQQQAVPHPHHHHHHQARTQHDYKSTHPSAFHPVSMPSPPELLHDSEEDEEDSMGSATPSLAHLADLPLPMPRKSIPHRSPPAVKDAIQASALDKSVVFQLDVRSHPFFPAAPAAAAPQQHQQQQQLQQSHDHKPAKCPDCNLTNCCGMACTSRVICGESLLTALRKRVVQARSSNQHNHHHHKRRRMPMQRSRTTIRKTTHIDVPKPVGSRLIYHNADQDEDDMSYNDDDGEDYDDGDHHHNQIQMQGPEEQLPLQQPLQQEQPIRQIRQIRHHRPWIEEDDNEDEEEQRQQQVHHHHQEQAQETSKSMPSQQPPRKRSRHETPSSSTTAAPAQHQKQQQQQQQSQQTHHHASSGRPSRVKGPCQACQESSDGCMRKAFNWPFPTSSIYNDKGKKFVYLCNKCGLRYNKSGGCVCRHCRWVFCKEEKRKAMQHIEQMIRSRPDGKVDPDEDIENFVCTPKYWTCGRPWKVGWVLQNIGSTMPAEEEDEDMHAASSSSASSSPSLSSSSSPSMD